MMCILCGKDVATSESVVCYRCEDTLDYRSRCMFRKIRKFLESLDSEWYTLSELEEVSGFDRSTIRYWLSILENRGMVEKRLARKKKICAVWRLAYGVEEAKPC